jgi:hypothetical protein
METITADIPWRSILKKWKWWMSRRSAFARGSSLSLGVKRSGEKNVQFFEGGCLCGSIRYQVKGAPRSSSVCFCRSCRLASGAPSVAWFVVGRNQFTNAGA